MVDVTQRSGKYSRNVQVVVGPDSVDIIRSPSIFMDLVSILVDTNAIEPRTTNDYEPYDIENKIDFNDVIKHRERIEGFYLYSAMIDNAYETLNESMPVAKETALKILIPDISIVKVTYCLKIEKHISIARILRKEII